MSRILIEQRVLRVLRWVTIAGLTLACAFPFYYMVELSFVPIEQLLLHPDRLWVPLQDLTLSTYEKVLRSTDQGGQGFAHFMANSAIVATATALVTLAVAIPGAYAVSRLKFFGQRQISALFLAVYLFPTIIMAIPLFVGFSALGIRESLFGLVIVYIAQTIPVSIHMLRSYLRTIPVSIEEAAVVDGASRGRILRSIIIPWRCPRSCPPVCTCS
jgi:multiple sugar transport system permease protein